MTSPTTVAPASAAMIAALGREILALPWETSTFYRSGYTFTDVFCGAGGSSSGLAAAGLELKLAANHSPIAIETHSANFTHAEHLCADVNNYDMRRLPHTHVLWASPICTELSPSGGSKRPKKKPTRGQLLLEEFGHVAASTYERTRATFWDVIRATEVHRYPIVIIENVVEAYSWELFDVWLAAMDKLGYHHQLISVSAAHIGDDHGNDPAPQWRDRLYVFFTRNDLTPPRIEPRPRAWCFACAEEVRAVQAWKRLDRPKVGKYGSQYVYRCPNRACRHAIVEPFVLPAASAIDWSDIGERIGDRRKPLAAATMRRIRVGIEMFAGTEASVLKYYTPRGRDAQMVKGSHSEPLGAITTEDHHALSVPPVMLSVNHDGDDPRAYPADDRPLPTRSTKIGDAMVSQPFLMDRRYNHEADEKRLRGLDEPFGTVTAGGHSVRTLLVPAGGTWRTDATRGDDPMPARTTSDTDGLFTFVDVARTNNRPNPIVDPLAPVTTGNNQNLVSGAFVGELRQNSTAGPADGTPVGTIAAGGNHAYLGVPGAFVQKHHGGLDYGPIGHMVKDARDPLPGVVGRPNLSLVIPYRKGRAKQASDPLLTVGTRTSAGLAQVTDADVDDCYFRMLKPREHGRAQRFRDGYVVLGNQGEQTMQFGNAVASNVAQWLGGYAVLTLDGRVA